MSFMERLMALFGHTPPDTSERVSLTTEHNRIAGRLAKMKGGVRDEVLMEAYRRARLAKEAQSFRPRQ